MKGLMNQLARRGSRGRWYREGSDDTDLADELSERHQSLENETHDANVRAHNAIKNLSEVKQE